MNNIQELCKDVSFNKLYNWNNIPQKILNNATLGLGINNDEIVLFYDSSSFGNGKTGLAICNNGLYWKNSFCTPRYLSWNAFRKTNLSYDKNHIYIGQDDNFWIYENVEQLLSVLNNLKFNLKVDSIVEKTEGIFGFIRGAIDFVNELDSGSNNTENSCNNQQMIGNNSSEIIEVACDTENINRANYEELVKEIENVKEILTYLNKDLIGELSSVQVNNDEELKMHIIGATMSAITLTGDEELLSLLDEDTKQNIFEIRNTLNPQLELVENILNSDSVNYIEQEKISLKKAINLYTHRVKTAMEEYEDSIEDEDDFEEVYDSIQLAVKDFRKTLKKMIKICNLFIEKIYIEA
ncbi:Uncharacterised protein [uncultured Clostridium sp.]|nr:Uncharacterised protein [uncultured Clostridium sp.]SCI99533.1 Uncharacterised protein [uncultured Clostridium sp.]